MSDTKTTRELESIRISWTHDLAIGHAVIDADHRAIFDAARRLHDESTGDMPEHSIVGEILVELIEHTGGHFAREEALMEKIGFAGSAAHKHEHALLMQKVNNLHRQFMDGRDDLHEEVADFIQYGLIRHIMKSDVALGRAMRRK